MFNYESTVAVVTGGASGIGLAAASAFAARGADVVLADINADRLDEAAEAVSKHGTRVITQRCDVGRDADVDELAEETLRAFGRADIIMNNAGVAVRGLFEEIPLADWEWILNINVLGVVRGCRAFIPHLVQRGSGWIVNTASIGGLAASTIGSPYITSKHAVVGLSESLSLSLRPRGVGVSVLCPAGVATNIMENMRVTGPEGGAGAAPEVDTERLQQPDAVASMLLDGIDADAFVIPTFPLAGPLQHKVRAIDSLAKRNPTGAR